jgi:prepilin-type N-terminal cleavage/methylation domain-containing protein
MRNSKGFTLVEMAVVLVIIGIILGAVIKGGDLIDNAKEKQFKSEVSTLTTSYYNYLDKYGRLPGDDNNATTRWAAATSGDNSGLIGYDTATPPVAKGTETAPATGALDHLRRAGFISDQPVNTATAFTSKVYNGASMNFGADITTKFGKASNLLIISGTGWSADDQLSYDTKYDDGAPGAGDIQSSTGAAYNGTLPIWIRLR